MNDFTVDSLREMGCLAEPEGPYKAEAITDGLKGRWCVIGNPGGTRAVAGLDKAAFILGDHPKTLEKLQQIQLFNTEEVVLDGFVSKKGRFMVMDATEMADFITPKKDYEPRLLAAKTFVQRWSAQISGLVSGLGCPHFFVVTDPSGESLVKYANLFRDLGYESYFLRRADVAPKHVKTFNFTEIK